MASPSARGFLTLFLSAASGWAAPLTLSQAVEQSLEKYPAVRASLEQVAAAAAGINLARTSYLPRADFLGQVNRATRNNVFGLLLPQATLPGISGPVLGTNSLTNVWGTAAGFLVSWEPFDFGLRQANVDIADASRRRADTAVARTRLEVATAAADAFLTILAAEQAVRAAQAGVDRARSLREIVGALVKAELRPGADGERTRAELALAEVQLIQARQATAVARAALAQFLGVSGADVAAQAGRLLDLPPAVEQSSDAKNHPSAREQNAAVEEVKAREKALDRSYYPKLNLQAALYARGSGANPDGTTGGAAAGLGPNIQNWALGFTVTFPVMELASIRARKQIEAHRELAESARYDQTLRDIAARVEKAQAALDGSRLAAGQAPVQFEAAVAVEQQATARYRAGLASFVEVADAERLLMQADVDNALARLQVWRAMLAVAAAQGNLEPFLQQTR